MKWRLLLPLVIITLVITLYYPPTVSHPPSDPDNPTLTLEDKIRDMIDQINENMVFDYHDSLMDIGPRYTGT